MTHFIERKHLLQWLAKNCTRKSVVRAMDEGTVEHLGAFTQLGPWGEPGWLVKVTSDTGKLWIVCVVLRPASERWYGYSIYITPNSELPMPCIPWECWDGDNFTDHLYRGDNPTEYRRLKDERRAEIEEENRASENTEQGIESDGEGT